MDYQNAAAFIAIVLVWIAVRPRKPQPTGRTNVLDTFATSVDKTVTKRIVSRLPQLAKKR